MRSAGLRALRPATQHTRHIRQRVAFLISVTWAMKQTDLSLLLPDMLPRLWSFAFRLSRNRSDAEELVQRACIRGLERAHQLRAGTSALNWMFSIVHSTWLNDLKLRDQRSQLQ